jgi:phosphoribosylformylglycinamidine synthase
MQEIDPELQQAILKPAGLFAEQVHQGFVAVDSIKGCIDEAGELVKAGIPEKQMLEVGKIDGLRKSSEGDLVRN